MIEGLFGQENYLLAKTLLDASSIRHQALAGNLANVETPGYRRVDLSVGFEQELAAAVESGDFSAVATLKPALVEDPDAVAVRPDGNNVQLERELLEINRNALHYEFFTQYLSGSIKQLKTAISGRNIS